MRADYIARIDLDIVQGIIRTQLEQFQEMKERATVADNAFNYSQAIGGIVALEQVGARLVEAIKRGAR